MYRVLAFVAAITLFTAPSLAEPLTPTSRWNVDFSKTQCVATRSYEDGDKTVHLAIKPYVLGRMYEVALIEDGFLNRAESRVGTLRLDERELELQGLRYGDKRGGRFVVTLFGEDLGDLTGVEQIDIQFAGIRRTLKVTKMDSLVDVLEDCRSKLGTFYNLGADLQSPPKGDIDVLSGHDYPMLAIERDAESMFRAAVLIDEEGTPVDCTLLSYAGDAMFVTHSCGLIKERARFEPAVDKDGKPTRSVYISGVRIWQIGGDVSDRVKKEFAERDAAFMKSVGASETSED